MSNKMATDIVVSAVNVFTAVGMLCIALVIILTPVLMYYSQVFK